ncbi:MAG: hypothetical protein GEU79_01190 [Acidimicrobiia bacterium]|nr:hypothetical protein [Acidimicrobiia bacterium]
MTIESELDAELKDAMKTGDTRRRDVIRQVRSEIQVKTSDADFSDGLETISIGR